MNAAPMFKLDGQFICYLVLKQILTEYDLRFSHGPSFDSMEIRTQRWEKFIFLFTCIVVILNIVLGLSLL